MPEREDRTNEPEDKTAKPDDIEVVAHSEDDEEKAPVVEPGCVFN